MAVVVTGAASSQRPLYCILFALRREALFFWKLARGCHRFANGPCLAWRCDFVGQPVVVVETGIGQAAAGNALRWVLDNPVPPDRIISAGFSGALQPTLSVGDLVWATEVVGAGGNRWPVQGFHCTISNARHGRLLTTREMIGAPDSKRLLGQQHQALAVDMETAEIAKLCHARGIPLACVRVVSDDWQTPLPPQVLDLLKKGKVAPVRLIGALVCRPNLVGPLWQLGRQTRKAARCLAEGLKSLVSRHAALDG